MNKGLETREMIIEQAAELFNVYGYDGCSLSDIMKATKLKKGGIYNHFDNKDEIALAAFDYSSAKVIKRFRSRLDKDKTSKEKLYSIIDVFQEFVNDPVVKGGCPIYNTAVDATGSHPKLRERAIEAMNLLNSYVRIKIEDGIKSGEFKPSVDAEEFATLLITSLEGALILSRVDNNDKAINISAGFLRNYIKKHLEQ